MNGSGSQLTLADQSKLDDGEPVLVRPNESKNGKLGKTHVIVLAARKGFVNVRVEISSSVRFGDWTDHASILLKRKENVTDTRKTYITTNREVAVGIWMGLGSVFLFIALFSCVTFYASPSGNAVSKTKIT